MNRLNASYSNSKQARILRNIELLPDSARRAIFRLYKVIRKAVRTKSLILNYSLSIARIEGSIKSGMPYNHCILALRLAAQISKAELTQLGAQTRVYRPLIKEAFHLIRIRMQVLFNMRVHQIFPEKTFGACAEGCPLVHTYCDGSYQADRARIGVLILKNGSEEFAEITRCIAEDSAFAAEMIALKTALETLIALQVTNAVIHVDAHGLLHFSDSKHASHNTVELEIRALIARFSFLKIILVPRLLNFRADRLAALA